MDKRAQQRHERRWKPTSATRTDRYLALFARRAGLAGLLGGLGLRAALLEQRAQQVRLLDARVERHALGVARAEHRQRLGRYDGDIDTEALPDHSAGVLDSLLAVERVADGQC